MRISFSQKAEQVTEDINSQDYKQAGSGYAGETIQQTWSLQPEPEYII